MRGLRVGACSARWGGGGEALPESRELAVDQPQLGAQPRGELSLQSLHLHQLASQLLVVRPHLGDGLEQVHDTHVLRVDGRHQLLLDAVHLPLHHVQLFVCALHRFLEFLH